MIFLDLDGTTLDVEERWYATYCEILAMPDMRGLPIPRRRFWENKRRQKSWEHTLSESRLLPTKCERSSTASTMASRRTRRLPSIGFSVARMYCARESRYADRLRDPTTRRRALENQLALLDLRRYFVEVLFGAPPTTTRARGEGRGPGTAELIRSRYRLPPTDALFTGDTETDVHCARALGWQVFLVECGHRTRKLQPHADPDRGVLDLGSALVHALEGGRWSR